MTQLAQPVHALSPHTAETGKHGLSFAAAAPPHVIVGVWTPAWQASSAAPADMRLAHWAPAVRPHIQQKKSSRKLSRAASDVPHCLKLALLAIAGLHKAAAYAGKHLQDETLNIHRALKAAGAAQHM